MAATLPKYSFVKQSGVIISEPHSNLHVLNDGNAELDKESDAVFFLQYILVVDDHKP